MRNDMSCNRRMTREMSTLPEHMPIGMSYVPWQKWQYIYDAEKGFRCGTIFQELYKPFQAKGGCRS